MNGRDLGRAWRTDDGGGPSSKHRLTVIQLFVIAWDSSSIRAARSSAPVSGCHGTRGAEDFFKSMKAGWLRGHGGTPALLHVRERSGIMARRGAAGEGVDHA